MENLVQSVDNPGANANNSVITNPAPMETPSNTGPTNTPASGDPTEGLENPLFKLLGADGGNENLSGEPTDSEPETQTPKPDDINPANEPQDIVIPDKFKNTDGTVNVNALLKSYTSLENKFGEQGNQLGQMQTLQQQVERLTTLLEQGSQVPEQGQQKPDQQNQQSQPESIQLTPEQRQEMNEQFLQDFYDNPIETMLKAFQSVAQNAVKPVIEQFQPLLTEREQAKQAEVWNSQVQKIAEANQEEFVRLKPVMNEVIQSQADILNALPDSVNKVEYVFNQAKAMEAAKNKPKTPEELLGDPEFQQKILQNEAIKNMIIKSHVESVKNGQPPVVIGNIGGQPPAAPTNEIKNTSDATKAAKNYFARLLGGGGM